MDAKEPLSRVASPVDSTNHLVCSAKLDGVEQATQILDTNKHEEFLNLVRELRTSLDKRTNECGLLKIKLSESNERAEILGHELDGCKLTMLQNNEDSKKLHEEVIRSRKLEEDYVNLMSSYLNLEERYEQHRQNLYNNYLAKTNAINNYESIMSREVIRHELEECKLEMHEKIVELSLVSAKLRNLEEDNSTKENCIGELRKSLDDARVAHKHEISVLEEYIQCLKNTIVSYEKTLASYLSAHQHPQDTVGTGDSVTPIEETAGMIILTSPSENGAQNDDIL